MPNAFVPIKPIPESSSGYENFLKFLGNAGAVTNLADSIMYRHLPDPKGRYNKNETLNKSVPYEKMLVDSPEKNALLKAEPLLKKAVVTTNPTIPTNNAFTEIPVYGNDGYSAKIGLPDSYTKTPVIQQLIKHEMFGHAPTVIRMGRQTNGMPLYYDRAKDTLYDELALMNASDPAYAQTGDLDPRDAYRRNSQEIIAESNMQKDKDFSRRLSDGTIDNHPKLSKSKVLPDVANAVPPENQFVHVYPQYMQNPNLLSRIRELASKMGRAIPALTAPAQILDMKNLYNDINDKGMNAGYAKWLGLHTQSPDEAIY